MLHSNAVSGNDAIVVFMRFVLRVHSYHCRLVNMFDVETTQQVTQIDSPCAEE